MATLTSTGINCSNGTLDGQYTGSTPQNTSYPIGSYLFIGFSNVTANINATITPYCPANNGLVNLYTFSGAGTGSVAMAGTWRNRGGNPAGCAYNPLIQRVA